VTIATLTYTHFYHPRQIIASIFVLLWALRLGSFLLYRVLKTGKDSRFEEVLDKPGMSPFRGASPDWIARFDMSPCLDPD